MKQNRLYNHVKKWLKCEAIEYDDGVEGILKDLFYGGCESGIVTHLIYYKDTAAFFDEYYEEIEEIRLELEETCGEPLKIKDNLKNYFAWVGFEETARKIANDLNIDV